MKMLIKSNKPFYNLPPLKNTVDDIEADIVYDDNGKCDLFNKYFSCISGIDDANVLFPDFESRTGSSISDILCTEEEIVDVITNLAVNKASGPDIISHKMLQVSPKKIAAQYKYPKLWKKANVMPIFKKGNNSYSSNYRPISLISCVGKVMERVVYKHVYSHLQSLKLIYEFQSGFLPRHSTVHQLLEMYNSILNSLERKEMCCFVFYDFSKAFDKVWHRGLLHKLKAYGINGNLFDWFHSYLNEREQRVVIKDSSSSFTTILGGGPPRISS